ATDPAIRPGKTISQRTDGPSGAEYRGVQDGSDREPRVAPTEAATTHSTAIHCGQRSDSPSTMRPTRAATAGSRLIRIPNTRGGIRRNASSSSEYGTTEDIRATPN